MCIRDRSDRGLSHHKNDGLIFMLNKHPVDINTSSATFKWKSHHTVDVLVREVEDEWCVYAQRHREAVPLNKLVVNNEAFSVHLVANEVVGDGAIVECECTLSAGVVRMFPLKRRIDKASPNSVYTIERTLVNIVEDIGIDELIDLLRETK